MVLGQIYQKHVPKDERQKKTLLVRRFPMSFDLHRAFYEGMEALCATIYNTRSSVVRSTCAIEVLDKLYEEPFLLKCVDKEMFVKPCMLERARLSEKVWVDCGAAAMLGLVLIEHRTIYPNQYKPPSGNGLVCETRMMKEVRAAAIPDFVRFSDL